LGEFAQLALFNTARDGFCGFAAPQCGKALPYRRVRFPIYEASLTAL